MEPHKVVTHDEWIAARKAYLVEEKAFTHARDELSRKRRALPWERVQKTYLFDTPDGKQSLADLFGGKSQLIIYHFMLGPGWEAGCPSCSYLADHFDGAVIHLAQRDVRRGAGELRPKLYLELFLRSQAAPALAAPGRRAPGSTPATCSSARSCAPRRVS